MTLYQALSPVFVPLAVLWPLIGVGSLVLVASKMGYLRCSDLMIILLGPFWFITPYWWDETGRKLWVRSFPEERTERRKCRREGHAWRVGFDLVTFAPKSRTCSRCLRHESARTVWRRKW